VKAALFERPHRLVVTDRPLRRLRPDEAVLRVQACGICGTDVHIVEGSSRSTPPVILGHEYCGVVEDVGESVDTITPGDFVAVDPNVSCGHCPYCRRGLIHLCQNLKAYGVDLDGGMAERCLVRSSHLYRLPQGMATDVAVFAEPVSCCVHGIDRANIEAGDAVVLLGGGTIGLIMLQLTRNAGAARTIVVEPIERKRLLARDLGADVVLDPATDNVRDAVLDHTRIGADVVVECAGRKTTAQQALDLARRGGTVVMFGVCAVGHTIDVEPNAVYSKELNIVGSYINPYTFTRAISLLEQRKVRVDKFHFDRFPLDGIHDALARLRKGEAVKSLILPVA